MIKKNNKNKNNIIGSTQYKFFHYQNWNFFYKGDKILDLKK
jgi:hypothetical protein